MTAGKNDRPLPLSGVRVLDISQVMAGPYACMLLGGMGPMGELHGDAAKLFAALFALYSGLVFLAVTGLALTPVFHHVLHRFHWEWTQEPK